VWIYFGFEIFINFVLIPKTEIWQNINILYGKKKERTLQSKVILKFYLIFSTHGRCNAVQSLAPVWYYDAAPAPTPMILAYMHEYIHTI
jgi:hypothetical protein